MHVCFGDGGHREIDRHLRASACRRGDLVVHVKRGNQRHVFRGVDCPHHVLPHAPCRAKYSHIDHAQSLPVPDSAQRASCVRALMRVSLPWAHPHLDAGACGELTRKSRHLVDRHGTHLVERLRDGPQFAKGQLSLTQARHP